jgi:hypothetical protein
MQVALDSSSGQMILQYQGAVAADAAADSDQSYQQACLDCLMPVLD